MTLLSEQNDARNTQISKDAQRCVDLGRTLSCFECFVQDYSLVQAEVDGILRRFFTARIGMRFSPTASHRILQEKCCDANDTSASTL